MAIRHRKLVNDSDPIDPLKFCEQNCDPIKNPDKICSTACLWCPPFCDNPPPTVVFTAPPENPHRISLLLTVSLSALAAVFFLFTCYTIYKFYSNWCSPARRRRRRSRRREDAAGGDPEEFPGQEPAAIDHHVWYIRTIGLQPSVIGAITIIKYRKGDGLIDGSDCSVCLSEFQEDETLRLLPKCNHAFHVSCIDTWLGSHTNCPMCRAGIVDGSADLPSARDQIVQDSGPGEGGILMGSRGAARDSVNESNEPMVGDEDRTVSLAHPGVKIDQGGLLDGIQPLRRSVSVDSLAAVGKSDNQSVRVKDCESGVVVARRAGFNQGLLRLLGSPSVQMGPTCSMKRSHSCSANVLLLKHSSRNRT